MTKIYSSAALRTKQREIKDVAQKELVHITENGNGAFVFCSEEVLERIITQERENALYEARVMNAFERADADMVEGEYFTDVKKAREFGEALRKHRA